MGTYDDIVRSRVESALQEGLESQRAFRDRPPQPSRFKGLLQEANRFAKRIFVSKSASKSSNFSRPGDRIHS